MRVTGGRDAWSSGRVGTDLKGAIAVRRVRVGGRGVVVFVYVRLVIHGRPLTASSHCGPGMTRVSIQRSIVGSLRGSRKH